MHELVEGLSGVELTVEVVADDFLVVGFEDTESHSRKNHDHTVRCHERNVRLNSEKVQLKKKSVPFIGHIATGKGLQVDPDKVKAIQAMPVPKDVAAVQRLLGLAQYIIKFLPHLSDMTKSLLTTPFRYHQSLRDCKNRSGMDVKSRKIGPVLRYYNLKDDVTLQCNASQGGL